MCGRYYISHIGEVLLSISSAYHTHLLCKMHFESCAISHDYQSKRYEKYTIQLVGSQVREMRATQLYTYQEVMSSNPGDTVQTVEFSFEWVNMIWCVLLRERFCIRSGGREFESGWHRTNCWIPHLNELNRIPRWDRLYIYNSHLFWNHMW